MAVRLIVNADDFGASCAVNAAVVRAHREGVLTSASLMVTGEAFGEAVEIAKVLPRLAVGLHLTVSDARSVLPGEVVPDLVDESGRFVTDPARAALRYWFVKRCREQLRMEVEAQFEAFAGTGLELSHVDGHQHLHMLPVVMPHVAEFAGKFGAKGIRVPREPVLRGLRVDRSRAAYKLVTGLGHAYLRRVAGRNSICDLCIGSLMSGRMSSEYVTGMLNGVKGGCVEIFFHPSEGEAAEPYGPNPGDLETLLSPALRMFVEDNWFELTTYAGLGKFPSSRPSSARKEEGGL